MLARRQCAEGNESIMAIEDRAASAVALQAASSWSRILARYRSPSVGRSLVEILITFGPFVLLWAATWLGVYFGYWKIGRAHV